MGGAVRFYAYSGASLDIKLWDEATDTFSDTGINLGFAAVGPGLDFATTLGGTPVLWVPYGSNGYGRWTGAAITNHVDATPVAPDLAELLAREGPEARGEQHLEEPSHGVTCMRRIARQARP